MMKKVFTMGLLACMLTMFASCASNGGNGGEDADGAVSAAMLAILDIALGEASTTVFGTAAFISLDAEARDSVLETAIQAARNAANDVLATAADSARAAANNAMIEVAGVAARGALFGAARGALQGGAQGALQGGATAAADAARDAALNAARDAANTAFNIVRYDTIDAARNAARAAMTSAIAAAGFVVPSIAAPGIAAPGAVAPGFAAPGGFVPPAAYVPAITYVPGAAAPAAAVPPAAYVPAITYVPSATVPPSAVVPGAAVPGVGAPGAVAQRVGIDAAIWNAAERIAANVGRGASVAVLAIQADSDRMSDYLIDELTGALTELQGAQGFTTMSRSQFDQLMGGLHVNTSGAVADATAQTAGRLTGVQYIVTGTFEPLADFFRFRTQVIQVNTAVVQRHTVDVQNDALVAYLIGPGRAAPAVTAPGVTPVVQPGATTFNQFSTGQRWGTFGLNWLVPGLGSFVVMNDTFGGVFQVVCGGLAYILLAVGFYGRIVTYYTGWGWSSYWEPNYAALSVGSLLFVVNTIVNISRSIGFGRNTPVATASLPEAWNIAIIPGRNGIEGVSLTHTTRF